MRWLPSSFLLPVLILSGTFFSSPLCAQQAVSKLVDSGDAPLQFVAPADTSSEAELLPLSLEDYGDWNRIASARLSPDGRWMSYAHVPNDGVETLFLKELDGERIHEIPRGAQPAFSADSRWVLLRIDPERGDARGGDRQRAPVHRWIDLHTGVEESTTGLQRASFSDDARWLLLQRARVESEAEHRGADLVLRSCRPTGPAPSGTSRATPSIPRSVIWPTRWTLPIRSGTGSCYWTSETTASGSLPLAATRTPN